MQARLRAKIAGFGCMPPSIICGCRRWPSAQAQSEISVPNPYRAPNRRFESISLQRRVSDEPMSAVWRLDRHDLLALVVSDRSRSVFRQGLEDQPETLPQPGFGYSLARQIGKPA
jgi:hypothetical protein